MKDLDTLIIEQEAILNFLKSQRVPKLTLTQLLESIHGPADKPEVLKPTKKQKYIPVDPVLPRNEYPDTVVRRARVMYNQLNKDGSRKYTARQVADHFDIKPTYVQQLLHYYVRKDV